MIPIAGVMLVVNGLVTAMDVLSPLLLRMLKDRETKELAGQGVELFKTLVRGAKSELPALLQGLKKPEDIDVKNWIKPSFREGLAKARKALGEGDKT